MKLTKIAVNLFVFLIAFLVFPNIVKAANYYVDSSGGNNSNSGLTTDQAWQTLVKVNSSLSGGTIHAGDTISFKSGQSFTGNLVVAISGSIGNTITFNSYGIGAKPVINASGYLHGIDIRTNKSYLTFDNLSVTSSTNDGFFIHTGGANITVTNCDVSGMTTGFSLDAGNISDISFSNVTTSSVTYGVYAYAFTSLANFSVTDSTLNGSSSYGYRINNSSAGTMSNIMLSGTTLNSNSTRGVLLVGASNVTLLNDTLSSNGSANIEIGGTSSTISLSNVTSSGSSNGLFIDSTANVSDLAISDSHFNSNTGRGIYILKGSNISISNTTTSSNGSNGFDLEGSISADISSVTVSYLTANSNGAAGISVSGANTVTVSDSQFSQNTQDGVSFNGAGNTAVVRRTTSSNNQNDGFNVHGTWSGVVFEHDIANTNGINGLGSDGDGFSCHETSSCTIRYSISKNNKKTAVAHIDTATADMYENLFYNDTNGTHALVYLAEGAGTYTLYNNDIYSAAHIGSGVYVSDATVIIKNNIISGFAKGIEVTGGSVTEDYNLLHGATTANWFGIAHGEHSKSGNPEFKDPSQYNLNLLPNSPAIDAGIELNMGTDLNGYNVPNGRLPDIGAYEYYEYISNASPVNIPSVCRDTTPTGAPNLFQIDRASTSVKLYFTTIRENVTGYAIAYGTSPTDERFATTIQYKGPLWIINTAINHLKPRTTYYFKVRPINGCVGGSWSNIKSAKTLIKSNLK